MGRLQSSDFLAGAIAFVLPLAMYLASISAHVSFWDTGEMQTVPYILGIAHPTGFPAFTLLGWLFSHVVAFGSVAWRMSAMSALAMAFAVLGVYALAREFEMDAWLASASALLFATGDVVWSRGARTEVHALAVCFIVWTLVYGVRFARSGKPAQLRSTALFFGLGCATHPVTVLLLPGLLVLAGKRYRSLDVRLVASVAGIVAACGLLYAYLPVRSAIVTAQRLDPLVQIGMPPGRPFWDYDHPSTLEGFHREISGSDFDVGEGTLGIFAFSQYPSSLQNYGSDAAAEFGGAAIVLVCVGFLFALRDRLHVTLGASLAVSLAIPFVLNYHDEADIDRYLLPSYALLAVFAGYGAQNLMDALTREKNAVTTGISAGVTLALAAGLFVANAHEFRQRYDVSAERWADRVRAVTPDNAIVVSFWAYATPLAYASFVDGTFGDRLVEAQWIGNDRDYIAGWLQTRPVYAVAQQMPDVPGFKFTPADSGYPFIFRVTR